MSSLTVELCVECIRTVQVQDLSKAPITTNPPEALYLQPWVDSRTLRASPETVSAVGTSFFIVLSVTLNLHIHVPLKDKLKF